MVQIKCHCFCELCGFSIVRSEQAPKHGISGCRHWFWKTRWKQQASLHKRPHKNLQRLERSEDSMDCLLMQMLRVSICSETLARFLARKALFLHTTKCFYTRVPHRFPQTACNTPRLCWEDVNSEEHLCSIVSIPEEEFGLSHSHLLPRRWKQMGLCLCSSQDLSPTLPAFHMPGLGREILHSYPWAP